MNSNDSHTIQMISSRIGRFDPRAEVILFGSHARGQAREDSDWDILILIDQEKRNRSIEEKYRDVMFELELELGQPISTFIFSKHDWETTHNYTPLYLNIKKEGIRLA